MLRAAGTTVVLAYEPPYYLSHEPNRNLSHSLDGGASWLGSGRSGRNTRTGGIERCPVAQEQPVEIQAQHQDVPIQGPTDTYWTTTGDVCVQIYRDILGRLQDRAASRSTDCAGGGEQQLAGSILRFPNGQYWLDIPDAPGHELVVNSRGGIVEMTQ